MLENGNIAEDQVRLRIVWRFDHRHFELLKPDGFLTIGNKQVGQHDPRRGRFGYLSLAALSNSNAFSEFPPSNRLIASSTSGGRVSLEPPDFVVVGRSLIGAARSEGSPAGHDRKPHYGSDDRRTESFPAQRPR